MGNLILITAAMLCAAIAPSNTESAIFVAAALIIAAMPDSPSKPKRPTQPEPPQ